MTLYLIGLGLDWLDLSQKALGKISLCSSIYLETYTSLAGYSVPKLARFLGKKIISLDRKAVEETKPFLKDAKIKDVALLIYGDPLSATTHTEILQECKKKKIECEVVHAPSILTAVAETGLQLYKFGKVASIPFWEESHRPESFFDVLEANQKAGAHTLFLLDLRPNENKFLSVKDAIGILLEVGKKRKSKCFTEKTVCVSCARLGAVSAKIVAGEAKGVASTDFGKAPYCLIVPAKLHFAEKEFLEQFER